MKFKKLLYHYEEDLINLKGKSKKDYIGEIGTIIHVTIMNTSKSGNLYDVQFNDGQVWCLDREQFSYYRKSRKSKYMIK